MKLWRKMGNKVEMEMDNGSKVKLTGRQLKFYQAALSGGKATASKLLASLIKRI